MKARFGLQQQPVKICTEGEKEYIFLCLNETEGEEQIPASEGVEAYTDHYYEYDYAEIIEKVGVIDHEALQAHPEDYLDYKPEAVKSVEDRLSEQEAANAFLTECLLEMSQKVYA